MTGDVRLERPADGVVLREFSGEAAGSSDRGEYVVEDAPGGSVVRLTIVNVAPGPKLLGALTGRSVLRAAPVEFSALLASVAAQRST